MRDLSCSNVYEYAYFINGTALFLSQLERGTEVFLPKLQLRTGVFHPKQELHENLNKFDQARNPVSINSFPDDVLEVILTSLPITCFLRATSVCKRWNQIVHTFKFKGTEGILRVKAWYFMLTNSDVPVSHLYDPVQQHWYDFKFLFIIKYTSKIAASCGLICLIEDSNCNFNIYVCNPITKKQKIIKEPFIAQDSVYSNLAFSVDESSHEYTIAVVRSLLVLDSFSQWNTSIHIFNSQIMTWLPPFAEILDGWSSGNESVICNGILYFVVTRVGTRNSHALSSYNLERSSSKCSLIETLITIPFDLTCLHLMNLQNKLVLVGGQSENDILKRIRVWKLNGTKWKRISQVPKNLLERIGKVDDVFESSGTGDLIYIHTYRSPTLLMFDMNSKEWKSWQKHPLSKKKSTLILFSGFCFEPRPDISPLSKK